MFPDIFDHLLEAYAKTSPSEEAMRHAQAFVEAARRSFDANPPVQLQFGVAPGVEYGVRLMDGKVLALHRSKETFSTASDYVPILGRDYRHDMQPAHAISTNKHP